MVMNLNHDVHALANRLRKSWIVRWRNQSRGPYADDPTRCKTGAPETWGASIGAGSRHFLGFPARVQEHQRVMHNTPVFRAEFRTIEIHVVIQASWKHEASILIWAIRRQRIFHWNCEHLIRLAALPSIG